MIGLQGPNHYFVIHPVFCFVLFCFVFFRGFSYEYYYIGLLYMDLVASELKRGDKTHIEYHSRVEITPKEDMLMC